MDHDSGASEQARRQRQCIGKIGYLDPSEAKDHAKKMHKKFKAKFSAYSCPFCGRYHVGTDRTTRQKQRRAAAAGAQT